MANWQFPDGMTVAVVTSWDGGPENDRITREMLDKYGYKGTFLVRREEIGTAGHLDLDTLRRIAADGQEIGCYGPASPDSLTPAAFAQQIAASKAQLEALLGAPVIAFGYPHGFGEEAAWMTEAIQKAGFAYVRTGQNADLITAHDLDATGATRIPVTAYFTDD